MIVNDHLGREVRVFAEDVGGRVHALVRAKDKDTFTKAAISRGLLVEETVEDFNPETGEVFVVKLGTYRLAQGVEIYDQGQTPIKTPATLDENGEVITPPIVDTRYHARIIISEPALSVKDDHLNLAKTVVTLLMWTNYGSDDPDKNKEETAKILVGVSLIDPETVKTPLNKML